MGQPVLPVQQSGQVRVTELMGAQVPRMSLIGERGRVKELGHRD